MNERIREIRKEAGLSQQEFAARLNVTQSAITAYERGTRTPRNAVVADICAKFDVREEWLRTGKEPMHPVRSGKQELQDMIVKAMRDADPGIQAFLAVLLRSTPEEQRIIRKKAEELLAAYQAIKATEAAEEHQRISAIARQRADEAEATLKETQATTKARA